MFKSSHFTNPPTNSIASALSGNNGSHNMPARSPAIRVLIVDAQDIVRVGLSLVIDSLDDMDLVGTARNGIEAVELCRELRPDVVLLDLVLADNDGVSTIEQLRIITPETRIVVLSSTDDEALIRKAIRAGALSLLLKNVAVSALMDTIRAAHQGKSTLAQEATQALIGALQRPPAAGHDLSDREMDTLMLMMRGLKNPEIASYMMVSTSTVKKHVSSIFAKLNVSNRLEAVTFALQHRILDK